MSNSNSELTIGVDGRLASFSLPCSCYECVGSRFRYTDDGHRFVENNLKVHTLGEACETCGRPKSEYRDLGRKGYYECWWCNDRAAGPFGPEAAPPVP